MKTAYLSSGAFVNRTLAVLNFITFLCILSNRYQKARNVAHMQFRGLCNCYLLVFFFFFTNLLANLFLFLNYFKTRDTYRILEGNPKERNYLEDLGIKGRVILTLWRLTTHIGCRTAPLTSKRCILYIYSTNICTEYFKHDIYSPFFSLHNVVCFIILTYLVLVLFTFYIQSVLKLKKNPAPVG